MKNYLTTLGSAALAFSVVGIPTTVAPPVPTVVGAGTGVSVGGVQVGADGSVKAGEVEVTSTGAVRAGNVRVDGKNVQAGDIQVTGTNVNAGNVRIEKGKDDTMNVQVGNDVQVSTDAQGTANVRAGDVEVKDNSVTVGEMRIDLENIAPQVFSAEALKQSIEVRKQELEQEFASTTDAGQNILEDANPVRLAVHSLLASKELLGGIGQQVSELAKQVNDSVATTTVAEAKIQSRGFFTKLFFGGDSAAANTISDTVAQNQERIDTLTKLLDQANISPDIQSTLNAQITALEGAQTRLQDIAQSAKKQWGIFSWRLF